MNRLPPIKKKYKGFEYMLRQNISDDGESWWTAFVKLKNPLPEQYKYESYRNDDIIGCDSFPEHNNVLAEAKIKEIIDQYLTRTSLWIKFRAWIKF